MSVTWLFLRWLFILGAIAAAVSYLRVGDTQQETASHYESFPLIRGERASGMPLAGVSIDPSRRDVYAVIGGPSGKAQPPAFFIHWRARDGKSYAVTFSEGPDGRPQLLEIPPEGEITVLESRARDRARQEEEGQRGQLARLDAQLRPAFEALPAEARNP